MLCAFSRCCEVDDKDGNQAVQDVRTSFTKEQSTSYLGRHYDLIIKILGRPLYHFPNLITLPDTQGSDSYAALVMKLRSLICRGG